MSQPKHVIAPAWVGQLDAIGRSSRLRAENQRLQAQIADARKWLGDEPCTCREYLSASGEPEVDDCGRCIALSILRGPS